MPLKLELRRKTVHIGTGILTIILLSKGLLDISIVSVILIMGVLLSFISMRYKIPIVGWCLEKFDRPEEKLPGRGAINYLFGIFLLLLFFAEIDISIVYASIIILALGDSFSALVGKRLKTAKHLRKTRHPLSDEKLIEGTIFGMIAASLGAMLFVSMLEAVIASIVAMTLEGLELKFQKEPIDDNITIPIAAAVTIWIIRLCVF